MASLHPNITPELQAFIAAQPLFFVASAPLSPKSHVNLSPKGLETFRVLSPTQVVYLDLTGSGNETAAHVLENGRITFMFCAFQDPPKIVRLFGTAHVIRLSDPASQPLLGRFPEIPGIRQLIRADITRVQTSCGFGVPIMQTVSPRAKLVQMAEKMSPEAIREYRLKKNSVSIDGLPT